MKKRFLFFIVLGSTILFSCKKRFDQDLSALMNFRIETAFDEMTTISDQAVTGNMIYHKSGEIIVTKPGEKPVNFKSPCNVIITLDTLNSTKTVTVDYGTSNCDCNDGKTRRGKIVTTFTGQYFAPGTVITHTPVDYYVNDIRFDGTKTVTNMGLNSNGQPYFNVQIAGTATKTDGEIVTYSSTRVRTWVAGFNTLTNRYDDQFEITGNATGVFSNGGGYTAQTTSPIHFNFGCGLPVSGILEVTPQTKPVRTVDYGQGACDNQFTVTVNGASYTFGF